LAYDAGEHARYGDLGRGLWHYVTCKAGGV
ncbi:MAG: hypothetical protein ACI9W2_003078, partial [Gammaproteobacteria bacterium]